LFADFIFYTGNAGVVPRGHGIARGLHLGKTVGFVAAKVGTLSGLAAQQLAAAATGGGHANCCHQQHIFHDLMGFSVQKYAAKIRSSAKNQAPISDQKNTTNTPQTRRSTKKPAVSTYLCRNQQSVRSVS
jgi:hypothetical protein